jgi:hypothetical protein
VNEHDAQRQLASPPIPPSPNTMGRDRMRIVEREWVYPGPGQNHQPYQIVTENKWEIF